ncbi:GntR family transcriptional regulator [Saccharopolyspora spinosa]|uniref:DNA-binding GntR family transcriptional regulator n=1 Tax=Saccharopolyspora spinosa TaxID=60894 RepID=A0A2N3Y688_SACSN|nr:GntR family transcriptional regulator [Saccharopolyspora spinosa]PKW18405.1 DNA-binding GntR family transcriptional regulator [Saccharopolyspora spinosa]
MVPAGTAIPFGTRKQDWAYRLLREWILTGKLAPGQQLSQEKLAAELGVSRGPLRDALSRLATEDLVIDRAHQKWMVAAVSSDDARDVYNGRAALESMLGAAAAQASQERRIRLAAQLTTLIDEQRNAAATGDSSTLRVLDRQFHDAIYDLAGMPASMGALNQLRAKSDRYITLYLSDSDRAHQSLREHTKIVAALEDGSAWESAACTRTHVLGGLAQLIGSIEAQPATLGTPD